MSNVSIHGTLTTKTIVIKHSLRLLCLYIRQMESPLQESSKLSANIFWLHFPLRLSSISEMSRWNLPSRSMEKAPMFLGKNSKWQCSKWRFNYIYTPQQCMIKLTPAQFHCNFLLFQSLVSFCRRFRMAPRLLSVQFNCVIKSWYLNSCLICGPAKMSSFKLVSYFGRFFALNRKPFAFLIDHLDKYFYQTQLDMQWR
jgi:hypothetical protein